LAHLLREGVLGSPMDSLLGNKKVGAINWKTKAFVFPWIILCVSMVVFRILYAGSRRGVNRYRPLFAREFRPFVGEEMELQIKKNFCGESLVRARLLSPQPRIH
jgi:hypothetical protein